MGRLGDRLVGRFGGVVGGFGGVVGRFGGMVGGVCECDSSFFLRT